MASHFRGAGEPWPRPKSSARLTNADRIRASNLQEKLGRRTGTSVTPRLWGSAMAAASEQAGTSRPGIIVTLGRDRDGVTGVVVLYSKDYLSHVLTGNVAEALGAALQASNERGFDGCYHIMGPDEL